MATMKITMKLCFVFLLLCSALPSHLLVHARQTPKSNRHVKCPTPNIEAIYQFGDSISDTGNLIREGNNQAYSPFARLPYGQAYFHKPTGRCSNGLLMVDYFAQHFKLPLLDAFLNKDGNFAHGVNFAVAGSTALSTSILDANNIKSPLTNSSLSVQLRWFKSYLPTICSHPSSCKQKLAKALFIIETGGNDFNYAFFQQKSMEQVQQMVDQVIHAITAAVQEVIGYGATRVVVPGNFAIGCMPIYLSGFQTSDPTMYDDLNCLQGLNKFAVYQNNHLQEALKKLQRRYPNVAIVYADYFNAMKELLQDAGSLGFNKEQVQKACCGVGNNDYNFNITKMCGYDGVPVCSNPDKRVSWDGVHFTQAAYKVMSDTLLNKIVPSITHQA